jgi:hypothetical protein
MLAVKPQLMSADDFLDWELTQDQKWALVDGAPILRETRLMAGGAAKHSQIRSTSWRLCIRNCAAGRAGSIVQT